MAYRSALSVLAMALTGLGAATARAECEAPNGLSPCIDSDNLWLAAGTARFAGIPSTTTIVPGGFAFGLGVTYLSQPIVLVAPSADPGGREVNVVDDVVNASFLWAVGVTDRLELTAVMPATLHQEGSGIEGVTSQNAPPITRTAVRDARVGAAYALFARPRTQPVLFGAKARLEIGLPVGQDEIFAGAAGPVVSPSVATDVIHGRFFAGAEVGARLRESAELAGATVGHQLLFSLGAGADILNDGLLSVGVEAWVLPTLASQDHDKPDGSRVENGRLVPAEWHGSLRSSPLASGDLVFQLGAGTALPFSSETRVPAGGEKKSESFAGVTSPGFRALLAVRFAPLGRDRDGDGIADADDRCTTRAEDRDGFEDTDGCPELDNDRDGIPDATDRCRDEPETVDGFEDDDGCADPDDDGDGVPDETDRCRMDAEDKDQFQDDDGCPEDGPKRPARPEKRPAPAPPPEDSIEVDG